MLLRSTILRIDRHITSLIRGLPSGLRPAMSLASLIGHPTTVTTVAIGLLIIVLARGTRALGWAALIALGSLVLSVIIKQLWQRSRPDTARELGLRTFSFPSGHTYGSSVIYGLIAVIAWHLSGPWHLVLPLMLIILIVKIGLSRVYLGAHYPTDVIGGWILGALVLAIVARIGEL
jgi:undecaprenyl-diphosphatase